MITRGCKGPFIETWVLTSRPKVAFDEALMDQYHHLFFSTDVTEARRHFPLVGANMVLGSLRAMMSDFVILGRRVDGSMWDLSRTGMIKNASEFKEYFFSRRVASLDLLGGTPGARALQRATAKAKANVKSKSAANHFQRSII